MTLDQYLTAWANDAVIPVDALDDAARNVPILHARWWRYYTEERLRYKKLDFEYKTMYRLRWEYWVGKLDDADRVAHAWPVQPLKILTNNVSTYLDADPVLQSFANKRTLAEETLRFLEDVIKSINTRGYTIKNAIDFLKFKMGV